mmetsp:Transcript_37492/g.54887  ORF Transcript_37492/g.54887 Transcript_37492/m.54887 type:complete len:828 (+) Transcript_37492:271-2754(+)
MSSFSKNRFRDNGPSTEAAAVETKTSMDETINRMIDIPSTSSSSNAHAHDASDMAEFIPSFTWKGPKHGYYFGTSKEYGTGYHLDEGGNKKRPNSSVRFSSTNEAREIPSSSSSKRQKLQDAQKTGDELLAEAEANLLKSSSSSSIGAGPPRILDLTQTGIQNATISLQRSISKNQMKRVQYPNDPSKFMESELHLHDEIMSWKSIATDLKLYPFLVGSGGNEKNVLQSFMSLLHHENSDVSMSVLNVLVELLDVSLLDNDSRKNEKEEEEERISMGMLANALINGGKLEIDGGNSGGGLDLIVSNLGRLINNDNDDLLSIPSEEDVRGIDDVFTIMEYLMDLDTMGILQDAAESTIEVTAGGGTKKIKGCAYQPPAISILRDTTLLPWLLKYVSYSNSKVQQKGGSSLKLHASEILASLLQHEEATRLHAKNLSMLPPFSSPFLDDEDDNENEKKKRKKKKKRKTVVDGIEYLLQSIAPYRKKDPETEEECETLENIFDALAASLFSCSLNVQPFLDAQGIELMLRCLREKVHAGGGALRVLNYVLSGNSSNGVGNAVVIKKEEVEEENADNNDATMVSMRACEQFVDAGGLKVLFPLFMGRGSAVPNPAKCSDGGSALAAKAGERLRKLRENDNTNGDDHDDDNEKKKNKKGLSKRERRALQARKEWLHNVETNSIQIMYALTRHLDDSSAYDAKARLLVKFVESDCEKCDRLIELCLKYSEKMRLKEYRYYRSDEAEEAENAGIDVDLAALHAKLKGGGDVFHRVGAITAFAAVGSRRCHEHIIEQLTVRNSGISVIKESIAEFAGMLEEGNQKSQLEYYLNTI